MLSTKQRRFVESLLTNPTITAAAVAAGISEKSAHNYLKLPEVRATIRETQAEALQLAAVTAAGLSADALEALKAVVRGGESDRDKVGAARVLLTYALTANEHTIMEQRLTELEALLNDRQ